MFERVDGCTDGRQLESHPISLPGAFGSGVLIKMGKVFNIIINCIIKHSIYKYIGKA